MEKYISKSAVNAEIKRLLKSAEAYLKYHHDIKDKSVYAFRQQQLVMCELLSFLDTLEVKEVDFVKEFYTFSEKHKLMDKDVEFADIEKTASFFFQLGLKAKKGEEV